MIAEFAESTGSSRLRLADIFNKLLHPNSSEKFDSESLDHLFTSLFALSSELIDISRFTKAKEVNYFGKKIATNIKNASPSQRKSALKEAQQAFDEIQTTPGSSLYNVHLAKYSGESSKSKPKKESRKRDRFCTLCGMNNHYASTCYQRRRAERGRPYNPELDSVTLEIPLGMSPWKTLVF